jgi:hypothetical protein
MIKFMMVLRSSSMYSSSAAADCSGAATTLLPARIGVLSGANAAADPAAKSATIDERNFMVNWGWIG